MENKEWYLYVVDHHEGPFSTAEIKKRVKDGDAKNSSYVWKEGIEDWMMMSDVAELGGGDSMSDGHGSFAFITNLFSKKKAAEVAPSDAEVAVHEQGPTQLSGTNSGPDISDVNSSDSVWCLNSRKQFSGPYSLKNIVRKINDGEVSVADGVWKEGWHSFVRISNIPAFMEGVKPDVLQGKTGKKKKATSDASALGIGGALSVRRYRWYKSSKFQTFFAIFCLVALYQLILTGKLDFLLERIPGSKEIVRLKIQELGLKPLPLRDIPASLQSAKDALAPQVAALSALLPEPARSFLSGVQIPEDLAPNDAENLRETAGFDLKQGVRIATALPPGDLFTPSFYLSSNAPDGASFVVRLQGKEGTLIGTGSYEKTFTVEINKHIAVTPKFGFEGTKPLPKGQYVLLVYEDDKQGNPEVAKLFSESPTKRNAPGLVPAGKVAFVVDNFFLGGMRDANYETRLKESKEKNTKAATEAIELKEIALLLEQMANDSAVKYNTVMAISQAPARKNAWVQYRASAYAKLSAQVKASFDKLTPEARAQQALPQLYEKAKTTYELTEQLHRAETEALEKNGSRDAVRSFAGQAVKAIQELKEAISKVATQSSSKVNK